MRYSSYLTLILCALFSQSFAVSAPLAPATNGAATKTETAFFTSSFDDAKDDKKKKKEKKKPAKKKSEPKTAASKTESKKESSASADAAKDAKESSEAKTNASESKAAEAAPKKDTGFGWTAILVSVVVSLGAGAGIVLIFLRRKAQVAAAPAEPKALLQGAEAQVIVVESKILQPAAKREAEMAREELASEARRMAAPEPRAERASEKPISPKPAPAQVSQEFSPEKISTFEVSPAPEKAIASEKISAPEKMVAPEKATSPKTLSPEKNATTANDADAASLLLDDNGIDAALEGKTSSKDLSMLNELAQKPNAESSEDFAADQLLLPDETELLIEPEAATRDAAPQKDGSLLARYRRISTPEEERDFMNQALVCTLSNFEDVFGNDAVKPIFAENSEGSFLISKQVSKDGCAEVLILRNFPIDDFLMQETLAPVFTFQRSNSVSSGFVIKSPAFAKQSEQGWTLVAKGEILLPA